MSLTNFKISEGLNIKGLVLDNSSGNLTWDGDNIATEGYVTTAIGNISIPPAYITSVGSNLSVTDGELDLGADVVITDASQTLSNKTLSSPTITVPSYTAVESKTWVSGLFSSNVGSSRVWVNNSLWPAAASAAIGSVIIVTNGGSSNGVYPKVSNNNNGVISSGFDMSSNPSFFSESWYPSGVFTLATAGTSDITPTEISYLDGVTSSIQTQLDDKLVSSDLTGYATETYVGNQGFLVSSDLSGYATETYVGNQGFLTSADLSGYATETYVGNQGFITSSGQYITSVGTSPEYLTVTNGKLEFSLDSVQGRGLYNIVDPMAHTSKLAVNTNAIIGYGQGLWVNHDDADKIYVNANAVATKLVSRGLYQNPSDNRLAVNTNAIIATGLYVNHDNEDRIAVNTNAIIGTGLYVDHDNEDRISVNTRAIAGVGLYRNPDSYRLDVNTNAIATKEYVDSVATGLDVKASVVRASTTQMYLNVDYNKDETFDGINLNTGDRVLLKDQTDASQNGIYEFDGLGLVRTDDATFSAGAGTLTKGSFTFVEGGTNAGKGYVVSDISGAPAYNITWTQFSETGNYITSVGSNLSVTNNELDLGANVVITDATQTLSNKTLSSPTIQVGTATTAFNMYPVAGAYMNSYSTNKVNITARNILQDFAGLGAGTYSITFSGATGDYASILNGTHTVVATAGVYGPASDLEVYLDVAWPLPSDTDFQTTFGSGVVATQGSSITVSSTEIGYLDGVTSNIQDQLDAKQDTLATTTDVSVATIKTQNTDGVSAKTLAFGNTTNTTYSMGSDVTVGTLDSTTKSADIFLQILDDGGNSRTSKLTAVFNGGSAPIWTEYGVVDSGTMINAVISFDNSKNIIVNVTGSGTYAVRGSATSLL